ncbi:MAG: PEPxxWA-CTERM sorting domain-containing protein [Burkholderiales bacterium]
MSARVRPVVSSSAAGMLLALSLATAAPAQAQFFNSAGANNSYPTNLFPIDPNAPVLDFGSNTVGVGNSAPGSFSALAGSLLKAAGLQIGNGGTGNGSVAVTGSGATMQLGGTASNRLDVGSWGTGTLNVSGGGVVDAAVNAGSCGSGSFCNSFIGNAAGSTATMNISGAGSEVRTLGFFGVGQSSVFTQAHDGFDFGTPGGTTNAFVNITNGGSLRSQNVSAGVGPTTAAALGTEKGFATIVVDGPGSQWIATRNTVNNTAAFFGVGSGLGGNATISVANGGKIVVDGTGGSATSFDAMNIGINGGVGSVSISGLGSSLQVMGNNPVINVGRSGATGNGSLSVLAGATASALTMSVGRDGANGSVVIDGNGSQLNLVGVGTPGTQGAAGIVIGQTGGTGQMTVSNGGKLLVSDGGADSRPPCCIGTNPYLEIGRTNGSTGTLTVIGPGSTVQVLSTSLGLPAGTPDNINPYASIGRYAGATGQLVVDNGGKFLMQGNAVSTASNPRTTTLIIGGNTDSTPAAGGNGSASVSGLGSELRVSGADGFIAVGAGSGAVGTLTIADQGLVATTLMQVGRGATGTVSASASNISLSGEFVGSSSPAGANMSIGIAGGTGTVTLTNGSHIDIANPGALGASLTLGGSGAFPLGNGTLNLSGASQLNITAASGLATLGIGRSGTGSMTVDQGSAINVGDGSVYIGRLAGSNGMLHLNDNSVLNAGFVGVGQTQAGAGGTAQLVLDNSTINTTSLYIGAGGTLSGDNGVINATGDVTVAGTITPGHSPSRVNINCNFVTLAGSKLILDILDVGAGFDVDHLILGNDSTFDLSKIQLVFNFLGATDPNAFAASGGFDLDNFLQSLNLQSGAVTGLSSVFAAGTTWSDIFSSGQFTAVSSAYDVSNLQLSADGTVSFTAVPVPEPGTWALMLLGLGMLGWAARRRHCDTRLRENRAPCRTFSPTP